MSPACESRLGCDTVVDTQVQTTKYSQADILTFPGEEYVDMAQGVKDVLAAIERLIGS